MQLMTLDRKEDWLLIIVEFCKIIVCLALLLLMSLLSRKRSQWVPTRRVREESRFPNCPSSGGKGLLTWHYVSNHNSFRLRLFYLCSCFMQVKLFQFRMTLKLMIKLFILSLCIINLWDFRCLLLVFNVFSCYWLIVCFSFP